jgi:hypothetical protein
VKSLARHCPSPVPALYPSALTLSPFVSKPSHRIAVRLPMVGECNRSAILTSVSASKRAQYVHESSLASGNCPMVGRECPNLRRSVPGTVGPPARSQITAARQVFVMAEPLCRRVALALPRRPATNTAARPFFAWLKPRADRTPSHAHLVFSTI